MNNLSSSVNSLEWRRNKVLELTSQGYNQSEISKILQISQPTINRDITYLRQQAKDNIKRYIDERLPEEYEKCLVGLNAITKEAWNTAQSTEDKREKIQALSLAKECYSMKLELLTNATVVDDAIRFVSDKSKYKEKQKSSSSDSNWSDREESNELDYDEERSARRRARRGNRRNRSNYNESSFLTLNYKPNITAISHNRYYSINHKIYELTVL
jgi:predicted transcriptional regulator